VCSDFDGFILCMQLTQTDSRLVAGSQAGKLHVICTQTGSMEQSIEAHGASVTCLAINTSDTIIATGN